MQINNQKNYLFIFITERARPNLLEEFDNEEVFKEEEDDELNGFVVVVAFL